MTESKTTELARELFAHLLEKPHTHLERFSSYSWDELGIDEFNSNYEWTGGFRIGHEICEYFDGGFQIAVPVWKRSKLLKENIHLKRGRWVDREGLAYVEVEFSKSSPDLQSLKALIDEAYSAVWNQIGERGHRLITCNAQPSDHFEFFDEWIRYFGFRRRKEELLKLCRPAAMLNTRAVPPESIQLGASKIGGEPDLPPGVEWPRYENGKPLAFLGQFQLSEIEESVRSDCHLPAKGLVSLFSVWGWQEKDCYDPEPPDFESLGLDGWNEVIHTPESESASLQRLRTPEDVNQFQSAKVISAVTLLSFPKDDPKLDDFLTTDDERERYWNMIQDYESGIRSQLQISADHQVGGFRGFYTYAFPSDVLSGEDFRMLLKIGCDDQADMAYGDGGALSFFTLSKIEEDVLKEPITCVYD